ncbi:MAG TPA: hypothetical protein ACHBX0_12610 [Arsenophonus sp.]
MRITVQPAARARATFRVIMVLGKFHGVMATTTPTACLMVIIRQFETGEGIVSHRFAFLLLQTIG